MKQSEKRKRAKQVARQHERAAKLARRRKPKNPRGQPDFELTRLISL